MFSFMRRIRVQIPPSSIIELLKKKMSYIEIYCLTWKLKKGVLRCPDWLSLRSILQTFDLFSSLDDTCALNNAYDAFLLLCWNLIPLVSFIWWLCFVWTCRNQFHMLWPVLPRMTFLSGVSLSKSVSCCAEYC